MVCPNQAARAVSEQMASLFTNGAEVVDTSFMGAHVLMLKNSSAELRLARAIRSSELPRSNKDL
jgi:hypothetical protein